MAQMWIDGGERTPRTAASSTWSTRPRRRSIDTAPRAAGADVERAVAAAARAFPEWRRTPGSSARRSFTARPRASATTRKGWPSS
jgi:acyl-CoA reductase-like NAD-dependent aldehyde dehydrogenase